MTTPSAQPTSGDRLSELRTLLNATIKDAHFNHRPQSWVSKKDGRVWHGAQPMEECDRCLERQEKLPALLQRLDDQAAEIGRYFDALGGVRAFLLDLRSRNDIMGAMGATNLVSQLDALIDQTDEEGPNETVIARMVVAERELREARSTIAKQRGVISALLLHHDAVCRICPEARQLNAGEAFSVQNARAALDQAPVEPTGDDSGLPRAEREGVSGSLARPTSRQEAVE